MIEKNVIKEFKKALKAFVKEIQKKENSYNDALWYNIIFDPKRFPPIH